jgi:hypothetical protein
MLRLAYRFDFKLACVLEAQEKRVHVVSEKNNIAQKTLEMCITKYNNLVKMVLGV